MIFKKTWANIVTEKFLESVRPNMSKNYQISLTSYVSSYGGFPPCEEYEILNNYFFTENISIFRLRLDLEIIKRWSKILKGRTDNDHVSDPPS